MKTVTVPVQELSEIIKMQLDSGAKATIVVTGNSMHPMLRHRRDSVTMEKATDFARVGDVLFYLRENGQYVLHRVIRAVSPGEYICSGDNQYDHEQVTHEQVIARVVSFTHKGKPVACSAVGYRFYTWCFVNFMFLRKPYIWVRRTLGRIVKRLRKR